MAASLLVQPGETRGTQHGAFNFKQNSLWIHFTALIHRGSVFGNVGLFSTTYWFIVIIYFLTNRTINTIKTSLLDKCLKQLISCQKLENCSKNLLYWNSSTLNCMFFSWKDHFCNEWGGFIFSSFQSIYGGQIGWHACCCCYLCNPPSSAALFTPFRQGEEGISAQAREGPSPTT